MKRIPIVLISILIATAYCIGQETQTVITADGRKVILRPDKTWDYLIDKPVPVKKKDNNHERIEGDNIVQLTDFVDTIRDQLTKSEFETEAAYISRIRELLNETKNPATGRKLSDSVFVLRDRDRYNAETQTFSFSILSLESQFESDVSRPARWRFADYSLQLAQRTRYYPGWQTFYFPKLEEFQIAVKPDDAKLVKQHLRLAIYGLPVFVKTLQRATLHFVPTRYVAYNSQTGEVFAENKESDLMLLK